MGSGGRGGQALLYPVSVTAGQTIAITIGAGGAVGSDGGDTTFGSLLTLGGGSNGYNGNDNGVGNGSAGSGYTSSSVALFGSYGTGGSARNAGNAGILIVIWA